MVDRVLSCLPTVHMASRESARAEEKPATWRLKLKWKQSVLSVTIGPPPLGTLQVSDLYHDGLYGPFRGRIRAAVCPGGWCLVTGVLARLSPQNMGQGKNWAGSCESGLGLGKRGTVVPVHCIPQLLSRLTHSSSGVGLQI